MKTRNVRAGISFLVTMAMVMGPIPTYALSETMTDASVTDEDVQTVELVEEEGVEESENQEGEGTESVVSPDEDIALEENANNIDGSNEDGKQPIEKKAKTEVDESLSPSIDDIDVTVQSDSNDHNTLSPKSSVANNGNLRNATISLANSEIEWTGRPVHPEVTVIDSSGNELQEDIDYSLVYYLRSDEEDVEEEWEELLAPPINEAYYSSYTNGYRQEYYVAARALGEEYSGETNHVRFWIVVDSIKNIADNGYWGGIEVKRSDIRTFSHEKLNPHIYYWDEREEKRTDLSLGTDYEFLCYRDASGSDLEGVPTSAGIYSAIYKGMGLYTGTRAFGFELYDIHDLGITGWRIESVRDSYPFTGSAVDCSGLSITYWDSVESKDLELVAGHDYVISRYEQQGTNNKWLALGAGETPTSIGKYRLVIEGIGSYFGTKYHEFSIVDNSNLEDATITLENDALCWTNEAVHPTVEVRDCSGEKLVEGNDYELVYYQRGDYNEHTGEYEYNELAETPTVPAPNGEDYYVAARGKGQKYKGETNRESFKIVVPSDTNITSSGFWVYCLGESGMSDAEYMACGFTPARLQIVAKYEYDQDDIEDVGYYTPLVRGTCFEVVGYQDSEGNTLETAPSTPGEYYVVIEGRGPYTGVRKASFSLYGPTEAVEMSVDEEYIVNDAGMSNHIWLGRFVAPRKGTYRFRWVEGYEAEFGAYGRLYGPEGFSHVVDDHQVNEDNGTTIIKKLNAGQIVYLKLVDEDGFGGPFSLSVTMDGTSTTDLTGAEVNIPNQTYTGRVLEPAAKVKLNGAELIAGSDYAITYSENLNVGNAKVTIIGKGNYKGTVEGAFRIVPKPVTIRADDKSKTYGQADPKLTATVTGTVNDDKVEYGLSRAKGENAGSYKIDATGVAEQGNYVVTFESGTLAIGRASVANASVTASNQTYSGKALKPAVKVAIGGKELTQGKDYDVAYNNNVNAGIATVTVTGKGNYDGKASGTFGIAKAAQTIAASDKSVAMGKSVSLGAKASGGGKLSYAISDAKAAKVSAAGVVTPAKAGNVAVTVTAAETANYKAATKKVTVTVTKGAQPMAVKTSNKTAKLSAVKKKAASVAPIAVSKAQGKVTYARVAKGSSAALKVNTKTGKVTVKKGTKRGTYKIKVKVTAAGNANWKSGSKTVTCTVTVK